MKDNLKSFLTVKNSTLQTADLYFYGEIVSDWWGAWDDLDQYPEAIRDFLTEHEGKDLNIYVNSGGGSVFAGIAIYNMLLRHKGKKTVYVDGIAASIASVIALAGDEMCVKAFNIMADALVRTALPVIKEYKIQALVLGGQISNSFPVFEKTLKDGFAGAETLKKIIRTSDIDMVHLVGAAIGK